MEEDGENHRDGKVRGWAKLAAMTKVAKSGTTRPYVLKVTPIPEEQQVQYADQLRYIPNDPHHQVENQRSNTENSAEEYKYGERRGGPLRWNSECLGPQIQASRPRRASQ